MLVKICCIQPESEAREALAAGANAVARVAKMPTSIGAFPDCRIQEIVAALAPVVGSFLLTSRTDPEAIVEHQRATGANTLQLVDRVSTQSRAAVKRRLPHVPLVQVVDRNSVEEARRAEEDADALLLGSFVAAVAAQRPPA